MHAHRFMMRSVVKPLRALVNDLKEHKGKFQIKANTQAELQPILADIKKKIKSVDEYLDTANDKIAEAQLTEIGNEQIGNINEALRALVTTGEAHIWGAKMSKSRYAALLGQKA